MTITLCLAGLLVLQQGITLLDALSPLRQEQRQLAETLDIEPAALFYTEVPLALAGGRLIRDRLQHRDTVDNKQKGEGDGQDDTQALSAGDITGAGGFRPGGL